MGLFREIGNALNSMSGTKSSQKSQNAANSALQKEAQKFEEREAEKTRNFNAEQAEIQRQWEAEQSNTAVQRRQQDLKAAGINPVLAAGASADTGSGAMATGVMASSPGGSTGTGTPSGNPIEMLLSALNTAKEIEKTDAEIKNIKQETENKKQENKNGGTGGTGFTRTVDWGINRIKNLVNGWTTSARKTDEDFKKNGFKNLKKAF